MSGSALTLTPERRRLFEAALAARGRTAPAAVEIPVRAAGGPSPCSSAQCRLWFIHKLEDAATTYNMSGLIRLRGVLDRGALTQALTSISERHEILRARFSERDGEVVQETDPAGPFDQTQVDWSGLDAEARTARLADLCSREASHAFDLTRGGLFRCRLVRLSVEEHALIVTMHHIVSDGWSLGLLVGELAALYAAHVCGERDPLPPLDLQYADFAQWQRKRAADPALERRLAFWTEHLAGAPDGLDLPGARGRSEGGCRGERFTHSLDKTLVAALRSFAERERMTLFMILHGALAALMARLSGQDDIVIAVPAANRQFKQTERLIGLFVNTLLLRLHVDTAESLAALLAQAKEVALDGFAHQDVPLERVVEALNPTRSSSRPALFQVMLAMQNTPVQRRDLPGLEIELREFDNGTAKCELGLSVTEAREEVRFDVTFAADLFERRTVQRWMGHLEAILRQVVADPESRICDVDLLSGEERSTVLERFNATAVAFPADGGVHELFERRRERTPHAFAVEHGGVRLTYEELGLRSSRLAAALRARGAGPGAPVGVLVERGLPAAVAVLASLKCGAACLPLDPSYPAERLRYILGDASPRAVLAQPHLLAALPADGPPALLVDAAGLPAEEWPEDSGRSGRRDAGAGDAALIVYTSGSTGRPKGVELPHRALTNLIRWHLTALRPSPRMLQFASLAFDASFHEMFAAWAGGGTVVVPSEEERRDAARLSAFLHAHRIGKAILPGAVLQALAERHQRDPHPFPDLREVMATGDRLAVTPAIRSLFARMPAARLHNHYGPSETHVVTAHTLEGPPATWPDHPPIGRPIANCRVYVLGEALRPSPIGVVGEICVAGPCLARGYLGRPDLAAERFVPDPFSAEAGARIYRTGDLGRWRDDGTLECLGRNDRQIKIRGMRVEPGEVELRLAEHPAVREAAVVASTDGAGGKRIVAYFVPAVAHGPSPGDLRRHVEVTLPEHMRPAAFVEMQALPLSPNGKLDVSALPAPDMAAIVAAPFEAPEGPIEPVIAAVWADLLKVPRVGRHDNFFDLGGHSLLALQVVARLHDALGVEVGLKDLFDRQTPAALAAFVSSLAAPSAQIVPAGGAERDVLSI